jgi:hypothetical protein
MEQAQQKTTNAASGHRYIGGDPKQHQGDDMKPFLAALALATVITVQALAQTAYAAPHDRRDGAARQDGCVYEGYSCSDWNRMRDGW